MKKITTLVLMVLAISCENSSSNTELLYKARVVDYDRNCSSCIIAFPQESIEVANEYGISENNYYHAINLDMEDFVIGQELDVLLREAKKDERQPCIELYKNNTYKDIYVVELEVRNDLVFNDTLSINNYNCLTSATERVSLCMDSVVNDSRCPSNAICIWEGDAIVNFIFSTQNLSRSFDLHINKGFQTDTLIDGYKIELVGLIPLPKLGEDIDRGNYIVNFVLTKE